MSCNGPIIFYPACKPDCPDVPQYTFENDNLIGEGVFHQNVSNTIGFYGITNTDGTITVSLDVPNNAISIDLNTELLGGSFPDATTTSKGKVELSTDGEAQAKTSTTVVLTPSNLAALGATTTFAGLTEFATSAETIALASATLAVTPQGLGAAISGIVRLGEANTTTSNTSIDMDGNQLQILSGAMTFTVNGSVVSILGAPLTLGAASFLNFNGAKLQFVGVDMTASSILGTTGTAGVPTSYSLADFVRLGENNISDTVDTYVNLSGGASFSVLTGTNGFTVAALGTYFGGLLNLGSGSKLNFDSGHIQVSGVDIPADSFVRTDSAAGVVTSELVALYFGPHSTTEAWVFPAYVPDRDIDPATCTLSELATAFVTLVHDLEAVKRPTT